MKSVRVIQAHKDYDGLWRFEGKKPIYLTTAAGFVIEDHVDDWMSVAIAYSDTKFPDTVSKITYMRTVKMSGEDMHLYHYKFSNNRKTDTRDGRENNISILMTNDLHKLFDDIPKEIFFKIFKI